MLAADRVVLGPSASPATHDVLDLTSPDALAEVGGEALSSVLGGLIGGLGAPGTAVSELFGLTQPAAWSGGGWPVINAAALIADPVKAWLGFLGQVLALGTQAFADLLSSAATLLGKPAVVDAAGTDADPWVIAASGDLAIVGWATTDSGVVTLHAGMRWRQAASQAGGSDGPTISIGLVAEALALTLATSSSAFGLHVLPSVTLAFGLATPAGHPVSVSLGAATIDVPAAEASLAWTTAGGLQASFGLPGATLTAEAVTTAFTLPSVDGSGNLVLPAGLTDQILETLLAGLLADASTPWLPPLVQALGLGEPGAAGEAFSQMFSDPRGWVVARLRSLLSAADPAAVDANLGNLADVFAALVGTPSSPSSPARVVAGLAPVAPAAVSGSGRPGDPLVVPLQAGAASVGLALWLEPDGPPIPPAVLTSLLQPTSLSSWLAGAGAALSTSDLTQLLTAAGQRIPGLDRLVAGRATLTAGWDALITRCAGGDGLLPGGAPDIAGATASTLAGIAHADLPTSISPRWPGCPPAHASCMSPARTCRRGRTPRSRPWTLPRRDCPTRPSTPRPWRPRPARGMCGCRSAPTALAPTPRPARRRARPGSPGRSPRPRPAAETSCWPRTARPPQAPRGSRRPARLWLGWSCSAPRTRPFHSTSWISRRRPTRWPWPGGCCPTTPRTTAPTWPPRAR